MVDFNQGETITTAPKDLVKIMFLERWNNCTEAIESHDRRLNKGFDSDTYEIKARLQALYNILYGALKKDLSPEALKELTRLKESFKYQDIMLLYYTISEWLNSKDLTNVFTGKRYDSTRVEKENEVNSLWTKDIFMITIYILAIS